MFSFVKFFVTPNAERLEAEQHAEARLDLIRAEAASEYWNAMAVMLRARVARLSKSNK